MIMESIYIALFNVRTRSAFQCTYSERFYISFLAWQTKHPFRFYLSFLGIIISTHLGSTPFFRMPRRTVESHIPNISSLSNVRYPTLLSWIGKICVNTFPKGIMSVTLAGLKPGTSQSGVQGPYHKETHTTISIIIDY